MSLHDSVDAANLRETPNALYVTGDCHNTAPIVYSLSPLQISALYVRPFLHEKPARDVEFMTCCTHAGLVVQATATFSDPDLIYIEVGTLMSLEQPAGDPRVSFCNRPRPSAPYLRVSVW